jgi:1,2-diacylglycerol 3-alpha-glucosyltransferase
VKIAPSGPRVAIMFDTFGPYHLARLNAVGAVLPTLGLEVASRSAIYDWDPTSGASTFERTTLFRGRGSRNYRFEEIASKLDDVLQAFKPEAVLVPGWASKAAIGMLRWAIRQNVPAVILSESTAHDAPRSPWREAVKRGLVGCFAAGLVGGRSHAAYLEQLGLPRDRIFFGYDIVDNMHFAHGTAEARADEAAERNRLALLDRFFLASARFVPNKNLIGLIDAYAHYRQGAGASAWGLVLLGDGAQRAEIEARIAAHGIGDHVALPGFKQYGDLPAYYGLAGAFVHVSRVEPWGLVVNEAMAAGLPVVVSSSCGCAPELVTEGKNGFVVEAGDIGILADRLAELAGMDPNARSEMGERSSEIIAPWSPARFAEGCRATVETAMRVGSGQAGPARRALVNAYSHAV